MVSRQSPSFVFDEWMQLAQSDPEAFEERRRQVIEELIESAPTEMQQRLRGLQWRVDMERRDGRSASATFMRIYKMMMESVYGEGGLADALNGRLSRRSPRKDADEQDEEVLLPFDRPPS